MNHRLSHLPFDSQLFGYKVMRFTAPRINRKVFFELELKVKRKEARLLYLFLNHPIDFTLPDNCLLIDHKRTYVQNIQASDTIDESILHYPSYKEPQESMYELALLSGHYSRFKTDPNFEHNEFEKLYKKWMDNSVNRSIAISTLVYQKQGEILALLTLGQKNNRTDIGLVSVTPKAQGQQLGQKLVNYAQKLSNEWGFKKIQVLTQQSNEGACRFYEKCGFRLEKTVYVYHFWN